MIQLGPLNVKVAWLIVAGGLIAGYLLLAYSSPFKGNDRKKFRETIGNGLSIFIVSYFFGTIIFKFTTFISDPLSIISYPSGQKELFFATALFALYLLYSSRSVGLSVLIYIHALMYIVLPVTIVHAFFEQKQGAPVEILESILPWGTHPTSLYTIVFAGG